MSSREIGQGAGYPAEGSGKASKLCTLKINLSINEMPVSAIGLQGIKLINRLKRKKISYVKLLPAAPLMIKAVCERDGRDGKKCPCFPHIKTGVLDVQLDEDKEEADFDSG